MAAWEGRRFVRATLIPADKDAHVQQSLLFMLGLFGKQTPTIYLCHAQVLRQAKKLPTIVLY